jgi:excisionase family DNA binding protein
MDAVLHTPSENEQKEAKLAHDTLEGAFKYLEKEEGSHRVVLSVDEGVQVSVPESALKFLLKYLYSLSEGQAVSILPVESEMSTQQVADILNVSRPHLVKMLENDEIPYHRVGKHRRIKATDLMKYKEQRDNEREDLLDDLASQAQELDMGY